MKQNMLKRKTSATKGKTSLSALSGSYERKTDRQTNRPIDPATDGHEGP